LKEIFNKQFFIFFHINIGITVLDLLVKAYFENAAKLHL